MNEKRTFHYRTCAARHGGKCTCEEIWRKVAREMINQKRNPRRTTGRTAESPVSKRTTTNNDSIWGVYRRGNRWYVETKDGATSVDLRVSLGLNNGGRGHTTKRGALRAISELASR